MTTELRHVAEAGAPVRRALGGLALGARSGTFWLLAFTFFVCGASTNGLIGTHLIPALFCFFGPLGKRRQKTVELEREQLFGFPETALFPSGKVAQLAHRLEPDFGIAHFRNQLSDPAQRTVFAFPDRAVDFPGDEPERGPRLLQMFARFMDGRALPVFLRLTRFDRVFDLVANDPPNSVSERFIWA